MNLPDGMSECLICSTPTGYYHDICGTCSRGISEAITELGGIFYDSRPHPVWGVQVCIEYPKGTRKPGQKHRVWMAYWTPEERVRKMKEAQRG